MKRSINPDTLWTAIDVGTTKICVLIAEQRGPGHCEIIGIGRAPSHGLARGVVVDVAPAVQSIKSAIKEAELMAGCPVESAFVGISGSHINATTSHGIVPVKTGEVKPYDIASVIAAAKAIPIPEGQQILHVMPQFYIVDSQHRVRDPLGLHGVRLEVQAHIITGGVSSVQNLVRCCEMAGVKVRDIILEPIASADAVLSSDERELGVAVLDIGGGTSDFAIYHHGSIVHTKIFPIAGNLFTNDIALCLRTTLKEAERIKKEFGSTMLSEDTNIPLDIESVDGETRRMIMSKDLSEILQFRALELLMLVKEEIDAYHLAQFAPSGLVLTGGGSLLHGIKEVSETILNLPVRVGRPRVSDMFKETLDNPMYATGYGLLVHGIKMHSQKSIEDLSGPLIHRVFWRMKSWISDLF